MLRGTGRGTGSSSPSRTASASAASACRSRTPWPRWTRAAIAPPTLILGLPSEFLPHGNPDQILADLGLDAAGILAATEAALAPHHFPLLRTVVRARFGLRAELARTRQAGGSRVDADVRLARIARRQRGLVSHAQVHRGRTQGRCHRGPNRDESQPAARTADLRARSQ